MNRLLKRTTQHKKKQAHPSPPKGFVWSNNKLINIKNL